MIRAFRLFFIAIAIAFAGGGHAYAQKLGQGGGTDISAWRVAGALLICVGLAAGGALALRHRQGGRPFLKRGPARRLEVIETIRMGHQANLALVRCDGREFLIATSPGEICFGPEIAS